MIAQALALGKTPFDLLRGTGGEEKVLKNAKDAAATEALEIATYTALERLANGVGDDATAKLAASIRADEERMLERILAVIPQLTDAVAAADLRGEGTYKVTETGAADAARNVAGTAREGASDATRAAKRTTKSAARSTKRTAKSTAKTAAGRARTVPGAARAEGAAKGAVAGEQDLPIARYDDLNAGEIAGRLADLSQVDLGKVEAYERKGQARTTILDRIGTLRGNEPWAGYDEQTVAEIRGRLARRVRTSRRARCASTSARTRTARACSTRSPSPRSRSVPRRRTPALTGAGPARPQTSRSSRTRPRSAFCALRPQRRLRTACSGARLRSARR